MSARGGSPTSPLSFLTGCTQVGKGPAVTASAQTPAILLAQAAAAPATGSLAGIDHARRCQSERDEADADGDDGDDEDDEEEEEESEDNDKDDDDDDDSRVSSSPSSPSSLLEVLAYVSLASKVIGRAGDKGLGQHHPLLLQTQCTLASLYVSMSYAHKEAPDGREEANTVHKKETGGDEKESGAMVSPSSPVSLAAMRQDGALMAISCYRSALKVPLMHICICVCTCVWNMNTYTHT